MTSLDRDKAILLLEVVGRGFQVGDANNQMVDV
jgi:hypothetical protein